MEYKVLYRKYRPDNFENIVGQDYTISILKNSIINKKIAHAYIFNGPRGTGKTSTAKVFAKTINCENPINGEACGKCNSCKNIKNNPDIIEIDAASNNGVDEIRELINNIKIAPSYSKYKVYIIDEVHMMTQSAFNALLLTLEEPPEHIVFILATTNIESVPITILSRCQKFDFKKISNTVIKNRLKNICEKENIDINDEALDEITYLSEGGMRDALSILDQLSSNNKKIDLDLIINNFGSVPNIIIDKIITSLDENDFNELKNNIEKLKDSNVDYKVFIKKLIDKLSNKAFDNSENLNIEKIKNIIFDLLKIINNYNIQINPFILIELTLLEYIEKKNIKISENSKQIENEEESKIISREIIKEQNKENINDDLKKIRINNCFTNAKKEYLINAKKEIQDILKKYTEDSFLISMLIDSEVVAASDKVYILSSNLDSIVNLININSNIIEDKLNNIKIIALTQEEWNYEKKEYILNLKKGYKYELMNENPVEVNQNNNDQLVEDSIESIAEQVFETSKIEIE
jgi:DNA polymerase-3 subunit gamma/tau